MEIKEIFTHISISDGLGIGIHCLLRRCDARVNPVIGYIWQRRGSSMITDITN